MSEPEEQPKIDLDFGTAFLPSWAKKSSKDNPYEKYEGEERRSNRRDGRRRPGGDRNDRGPRNRDQNSPSDRRRPSGDRGNQRRGPQDGAPRVNDQQGAPQNRGRGGNRQGQQDRSRGGNRPRPRSRQEILASLPALKVSIIPDQNGVASLAKQIRMQGRAYPLFDIAALVLKRPDRFQITTTLQPNGKGQPVSEQWLCKIDDTLWLSQAEAIDHILNEHFDQFYESVKTEAEPPKGNFTFVAQCGISGKVLGPPNYHGYQDALRALHAERFSRMHFDAYKERVKIIREEEAVKKWIDEQSWKTEYKSKARPDAEPLADRDAMIADFKEHHLEATLQTGESLTISAAAGLKTPSRPLQNLIRFHVDDQRRFPLQVATLLSQMFARQGLQFFKVDRTITHVSVARPKYLDMNETPVSTGVQRIVEFIDQNPDCTRKKLVEALRPQTAPATPATEPAAAETEEKPAEAESTKPAEQAAAPAPPSPEETAIITDLHWLIHQGHVLEFSNGKIETAKRPAPRNEGESGNKKGGAKEAKQKSPEPTPAPTEPAPVAQEPSPTPAEPATVAQAPAEPTPVAQEPSPAPAEPAPVAQEPSPAPAESAPVAKEPAQAAEPNEQKEPELGPEPTRTDDSEPTNSPG